MNTPRLPTYWRSRPDLLGFLVWFFAGGILLTVIKAGPTWQMLLVAVLALTVLRIVPVFLCLLGTGLRPTVRSGMVRPTRTGNDRVPDCSPTRNSGSSPRHGAGRRGDRIHRPDQRVRSWDQCRAVVEDVRGLHVAPMRPSRVNPRSSRCPPRRAGL